MTTVGVRPADRLRPAVWATLAVGTAIGAGLAAASADRPGLAWVTASRAAADTVGVACVGLALVAVMLPVADPRVRHDTVRIRTVVDRALLALGAGWAVLVLVGIVLRAADAFGRAPQDVGVGEVLRWALQLAAGRGLVLTAGCALVVAGCAVARLRDPQSVPVRIPLVTALLGVLTPTVTGHSGSAPDHQLAVVSAALHAGAAALWVGGLAALIVLVAGNRVLLTLTLPRFSRLAGVCVVAVAVTGVISAQVRLADWGALLTSSYGLLVVGKAVALVLLAGLGGLARRRLATRTLPVLRWAGLEVGLMAVTLGLAAVLTQTAP